MSTPSERIEAVRRFSRFYTTRIGLLEEGLLDSPFSLTEARVIWELAHRADITATELARELGVDAGYLSRVLRGLQRRGILKKRRSPDDGRAFLLAPTPKGRSAFRTLDAASREQIGALLGHLAPEDQRRLTDAMATVEELMGEGPSEAVPYLLRDPHAGDLGWIVESHGRIYAREYGWDERFEATAAEIVARFGHERDRERQRCWIAERRDRNVGCVLVVARSPRVAQLRCLVVDPSARGLGIGRRLVQECIRFAGDVGYRKMMLWTVDILHAARRIYETEGFELTGEEPYDGFGPELVAQTWERPL
jgi:DNA-binding MarR family transcriptional regulator/N-acetylglutamate synthase-like GNAT family acetyltransferase